MKKTILFLLLLAWVSPAFSQGILPNQYIVIPGIGTEASCPSGWTESVTDTASGSAMTPVTSLSSTSMSFANGTTQTSDTFLTSISQSSSTVGLNNPSGALSTARDTGGGNVNINTGSEQFNLITGGGTSNYSIVSDISFGSASIASGSGTGSYTMHWHVCKHTYTGKQYIVLQGIGSVASCPAGWSSEVADTATGNAMTPITSTSTVSISPTTSRSQSTMTPVTSIATTSASLKFCSNSNGCGQGSGNGAVWGNQINSITDSSDYSSVVGKSGSTSSYTYVSSSSTSSYAPLTSASTTSYTMHYAVCSIGMGQ